MIVSRAKRDRKVSVWSVFLAILVFFVDVCLIEQACWGQFSIASYNALQDEVRDIKNEINRVVINNKILSREIRALKSDPEAQACAIRERLNFIKDNETIYIFTKDTKKGGALK